MTVDLITEAALRLALRPDGVAAGDLVADTGCTPFAAVHALIDATRRGMLIRAGTPGRSRHFRRMADATAWVRTETDRIRAAAEMGPLPTIQPLAEA